MFAHENCSMYVSHDLVLPILYSGLVLPVFSFKLVWFLWPFYGLFDWTCIVFFRGHRLGLVSQNNRLIM